MTNKDELHRQTSKNNSMSDFSSLACWMLSVRMINDICPESSSVLIFSSVGVAADTCLLVKYCSPASSDVSKYLHHHKTNQSDCTQQQQLTVDLH